ncbi:MAG TPA: response regulator [Myxococcota bacterium]|jgi:two-component system chemotaxis response regulator CheY
MKKVLVVDDSLTVRAQVTAALAGSGFDVVEACDGADALQKVAQNADLALVICDVNMPNMDGLEFLEKSRSEAASTVPVLMLTTEGHVALMERAKRAGAKGWMVKPFKAGLLLAAARKLAV